MLEIATATAPGKVNLFLETAAPRPDGYHELTTVFQATALQESVTVTRAEEMRITVSGLDADCVPTDSSNLVWKVAENVLPSTPVHLHIVKAIPTAGGMAGGSADAAAALVACNALREHPLGIDELDTIAARLGSDINFVLHGGTALGSGRGEILTPVPFTGILWWVFATQGQGLSTPAVFTEHDRAGAWGHPHSVQPLVHALKAGASASDLAPLLFNRLQDAALSLRPELARTLFAGEDAGALRGIVSGSGPTCAFLCADEQQASAVARALETSGTCRHTVTTTTTAPGAVDKLQTSYRKDNRG